MIKGTSPSFVTEILMMKNGTVQAVLKKNKQALELEAVSVFFKCLPSNCAKPFLYE